MPTRASCPESRFDETNLRSLAFLTKSAFHPIVSLQLLHKPGIFKVRVHRPGSFLIPFLSQLFFRRSHLSVPGCSLRLSNGVQDAGNLAKCDMGLHLGRGIQDSVPDVGWKGAGIDDGHSLVVDELYGVPGDYRLYAEPLQVFHQPLSRFGLAESHFNVVLQVPGTE